MHVLGLTYCWNLIDGGLALRLLPSVASSDALPCPAPPYITVLPPVLQSHAKQVALLAGELNCEETRDTERTTAAAASAAAISATTATEAAAVAAAGVAAAAAIFAKYVFGVGAAGFREG